MKMVDMDTFCEVRAVGCEGGRSTPTTVKDSGLLELESSQTSKVVSVYLQKEVTQIINTWCLFIVCLHAHKLLSRL